MYENRHYYRLFSDRIDDFYDSEANTFHSRRHCMPENIWSVMWIDDKKWYCRTENIRWWLQKSWFSVNLVTVPADKTEKFEFFHRIFSVFTVIYFAFKMSHYYYYSPRLQLLIHQQVIDGDWIEYKMGYTLQLMFVKIDFLIFINEMKLFQHTPYGWQVRHCPISVALCGRAQSPQNSFGDSFCNSLITSAINRIINKLTLLCKICQL